MAHGVASHSTAIIVHQALHGYADGHRLLASSISLKPRDAKIVATLSDASGSTANIAETGYLTGYPLAEAGLYALAKTWPAPEMPRPGCVWTHTLLVEFADLAALADLGALAHAFVRPREGEIDGRRYSLDISLRAASPSDSIAKRLAADPRILRHLLLALYCRPRGRVFSTEGGPEEREDTVLALWSQQWPRLRRSFRFCTLISSDRSTDGAPFDLQFGSRDERFPRGRPSRLFDADREAIQEGVSWVEAALDDLFRSGALRHFLRGLGAELEGGRELFDPLAELYELMNVEPASLTSIRRVVALLGGPLASAEARDIRTQTLRHVASTEGDVDETLIAFTLRNLHLVADKDLLSLAPRLGEAQWRRSPPELVDMLATPGREHELAEHAIAALSTETVLTGLAAHPELSTSLLQYRPELLSEPTFWANEPLHQAGVEAVRGVGVVPVAVIEAAIDAPGRAIVQALSERAGVNVVLQALMNRFERLGEDCPSESESRWLATRDLPNAAAVLLSQSDKWLLTTLCALAHWLRPDDVPNEYGEDPVYTALRHSRGEISMRSSLFMRSWVLARALGYRSRNRAELFAFGFEEIYLAALANRLPDEPWNLIEGRLPNSTFWGDWDRGRRLRAGILDAFVGRDLDARTFGCLLPSSDRLFAELASEATWQWGGRGYLRQVRRALRDLDSHRFASRIETLNELV